MQQNTHQTTHHHARRTNKPQHASRDARGLRGLPVFCLGFEFRFDLRTEAAAVDLAALHILGTRRRAVETLEHISFPVSVKKEQVPMPSAPP